ncbi:TniB family NTP-binding protein [Frateuria terrea]|uniref:TniB protein n=1 Tax=Frateuria terrea TaxID=529704 RepID=A0A1H6U9N5_9GAMM|nr:TniB family NTP-binding protein [Frateuria terrea]SEI89041.1 TniB protein [Frateuria terrea]SFP37370.1 TniB protein [Frateuria terrea]
MSTYSHLTELARQQLELPDNKRVETLFHGRFIAHERVAEIIHHCEHLMHKPRGTRPVGLLVFGPNGSGKTALGDALQRRNASSGATLNQPATQPTLCFSMSGAREAREVYTRLLLALRCPHIRTLTGDQRREMGLTLAKAADLRLLIVDEIQDVLLTTPRQQALALLAVKDIMNSLKVPVLALGTEDARISLEADQHLKARFKMHKLPIWQCDEYLGNFLSLYEATLALKKPSHLCGHLMMKLIVKETGGQLTEIVERLQYAAALAVESGQERITQELFREAEFAIPKTDLSECQG